MNHPIHLSTGLKLIAALICILLTGTGKAKPLATELFLRGHSIIPTPQKVQLSIGDVEFGEGWAYDSRVPAEHSAPRSLLKDLRDFYSLDLRKADPESQNVVALSVVTGTVITGADTEISRQAYQLKIAPNRIDIIGNDDPGLFYGVQTFLQLLRRGTRGNLLLPVCTIEDWPSSQLRFLHWDTKHHQDRIETLKRYLDWSARFKINMIGFELEDKFEYPSNPIIGAPGAFTTAQLQEIVNYGLDRHIQVVPQIQSPAHLTYVLKHPEFADLKSDGNNYQACLCDERTYKLIFSMYDDVIKATQGIQYFHVSTDEVYYAGICAKCTRPYNPENRSLAWVEFANRAHKCLQTRHRKMLAWVEYPVLAKHIPLLPPDLINGVMPGEADQLQAENKLGMRDLIYTSMQGEELLFPDNLSAEGPKGLVQGRLEATFEALSGKARQENPVGVYGAAWDDSGLHSETFWLGWSTVAQYGWKPGTPSVEQHVAEFMNIYYGPNASGMTDVYRGLQAQARFFDRSWDRVTSRVRGKAYGNSEGKGIGGTRYDRTLPAPALPTLPALDVKTVYTGRYGKLVDQARSMALENDILQHRLYENLAKADRNRYNLEAFLSLAEFAGHYNRLVVGMKSIEDALAAAHGAAANNNPRGALRQLLSARSQALGLIQDRRATFDYLRRIWEKSRFPKGQEVNGRKFVHVMDDTKDHWADRRADLTYMIAPEESIGLDKWVQQLEAIAKEYAKTHNIAASGIQE
jgi:hexosaminidase